MEPLQGTDFVTDHVYISSQYEIEPIIYVSTEDEVNDICRVCLQNNASQDWNDEIFEFCGLTFKEFYYKFTQLQVLVDDPHPTMLCQTCSSELKAAHFLMLKALESHAVLRGANFSDSKTPSKEHKKEDARNCQPKQNTDGMYALIKQNEELVKAIEKLNKTLQVGSSKRSNDKFKEVNNEHLHSFKISIPSQSLQKSIKSKLRKGKISPESDSSNAISHKKPEQNTENDYSHDIETTQTHVENFSFEEYNPQQNSEKEVFHIEKEIDYEDFPSNGENSNDFKSNSDYFQDDEISYNETNNIEVVKPEEKKGNEHVFHYDEENSNDFKSSLNEFSKFKKDFRKNKKPRKDIIEHGPDSEKKKVYMCAYCPSIMANATSLKRHEETHQKVRERKVICPHCAMKFYTKLHLDAHLRIHKPNREKNFKCEFCDKAYYGRGMLNVHRRIHLRQMLACTACPQEFYRKIDLDRHRLRTHNLEPLHGGVTSKKKYFIHCKECNTTMRTLKWKEHQAKHRKEPLLKCSLCDKEFLTRGACLWHMGKVHDYKKPEQYEQYIIYLNDKRISLTLLQQQELVIPDTST